MSWCEQTRPMTTWPLAVSANAGNAARMTTQASASAARALRIMIELRLQKSRPKAAGKVTSAGKWQNSAVFYGVDIQVGVSYIYDSRGAGLRPRPRRADRYAAESSHYQRRWNLRRAARLPRNRQ